MTNDKVSEHPDRPSPKFLLRPTPYFLNDAGIGTVKSGSVRKEAAIPMRIIPAIALLFLCASAGAQNDSIPPLPPLTDPPTNKHLPGKVVWADGKLDVERGAGRYVNRPPYADYYSALKIQADRAEPVPVDRQQHVKKRA